MLKLKIQKQAFLFKKYHYLNNFEPLNDISHKVAVHRQDHKLDKIGDFPGQRYAYRITIGEG